jgi:hypothetical protein
MNSKSDESMIPLPNPLHRKQIDYWKRMFEETGFKLKELEAKNKELVEVIIHVTEQARVRGYPTPQEWFYIVNVARQALAKHSPRNLPEQVENTPVNLPENE